MRIQANTIYAFGRGDGSLTEQATNASLAGGTKSTFTLIRSRCMFIIWTEWQPILVRKTYRCFARTVILSRTTSGAAISVVSALAHAATSQFPPRLLCSRKTRSQREKAGANPAEGTTFGSCLEPVYSGPLKRLACAAGLRGQIPPSRPCRCSPRVGGTALKTRTVWLQPPPSAPFMTNTYRAVYQTPNGPYAAYVDSSDERKAGRFFAAWQKKLNDATFPVALIEVAVYRPSLYFSLL